MNKPVKYELKTKNIFFFVIIFVKKKDMYLIPDSYFTVKIHKSNI